MWSKWLVCPLTGERVKPALITGVILFLFSHLMHKAFFLLGIPEAANFLDDFAIAILGALLLVFYISSTIMQQNYQRAKERMFLIAEINERVRNALTAIQRSTTIHDERERARLAGEAIEKVVWDLSDMVPTVDSPENLHLRTEMRGAGFEEMEHVS